VTYRRLAGESQKAGRWIMGFFQIEFSPHMYIRSSPRGPNRDPNQTLSNELLLIILKIYLFKEIIGCLLYINKVTFSYSFIN
jgi:hypothetical protein